jgi:hypothetical protein
LSHLVVIQNNFKQLEVNTFLGLYCRLSFVNG